MSLLTREQILRTVRDEVDSLKEFKSWPIDLLQVIAEYTKPTYRLYMMGDHNNCLLYTSDAADE